MTLQLRQVEVRAAAGVQQRPSVVEEVEAEVAEGAGDRVAVGQQMALWQMPAARADEQRRDLVVKPVLQIGRAHV